MTELEEMLTFAWARLDEDEQTARAAAAVSFMGGRWSVGAHHDGKRGYLECVVLAPLDLSVVEFMARHDPARALADVDAKRRIITLHSLRSGTGGIWDTDPAALCNECGTPHPCETLRLLVLPYAGHPEYEPSWRP